MGPDDFHIQLDAGEGKTLQAGEVGIAAAVIVKDEAEAPIAKLVHLFRQDGIVDHAGLGDFQMDKRRRDPVPAQDVHKARAQLRVHALDRREVDIDPPNSINASHYGFARFHLSTDAGSALPNSTDDKILWQSFEYNPTVLTSGQLFEIRGNNAYQTLIKAIPATETESAYLAIGDSKVEISSDK